MNETLNYPKIIIDLHERGYTEDFERRGHDLWWIQQKTLLRSEVFFLEEHYHIRDQSGKERVVFAVVSECRCTKGILISKKIPRFAS